MRKRFQGGGWYKPFFLGGGKGGIGVDSNALLQESGCCSCNFAFFFLGEWGR